MRSDVRARLNRIIDEAAEEAPVFSPSAGGAIVAR